MRRSYCLLCRAYYLKLSTVAFIQYLGFSLLVQPLRNLPYDIAHPFNLLQCVPRSTHRPSLLSHHATAVIYSSKINANLFCVIDDKNSRAEPSLAQPGTTGEKATSVSNKSG